MSAQNDLTIVPGFRANRAAFVWRGLDSHAGLEIAFRNADRPKLVTQVLAGCADPIVAEDEEESLWRLSLAARIGGLLAIQAATTNSNDLPLAVRCAQTDCAEPMEVNLPIPALLNLAREAEHSSETSVDLSDNRCLRLRRPTGVDQRLWCQATYADAAEAETAVFQTLLVDGLLEPEDKIVVAEALQDFDPLSCFELHVTCPTCGLAAGIPVDLEAVLLAALASAQHRLIRQVDRLARRYGWNEAEILVIPDWRRRRYLEFDDSRWLP